MKDATEFRNLFNDSYIKMMKKNFDSIVGEIKHHSKKLYKSIKKQSKNIKNSTQTVLNKITLGKFFNSVEKKLPKNSVSLLSNLSKNSSSRNENKEGKESIHNSVLKNFNIVFSSKLENKDNEKIIIDNLELDELEDVIVDEAPEPTDIIWENLEYSRFSQLVRSVIIYFISFLLITVSFKIILWISYVQVSILV